MDKFDALKDAAKPLQDFLDENCNPHTIVIVQMDRVDVYQSEIGMPTSK